MGFFDKLFGKKPDTQDAVDLVKGVADKVTKVPSTPKPKKAKEAELSAKEKATQAGEPYVNVLSMDIDPADINSGTFELDFNEIFVARLVKAGYMMKKEDTDAEIVDRWWTQVCRNVVLELYEQEQADPENRYRAEMRVVRNKDLGNGRTEVS
jgi:hypothetical protein